MLATAGARAHDDLPSTTDGDTASPYIVLRTLLDRVQYYYPFEVFLLEVTTRLPLAYKYLKNSRRIGNPRHDRSKIRERAERRTPGADEHPLSATTSRIVSDRKNESQFGYAPGKASPNLNLIFSRRTLSATVAREFMGKP